MLNNSLKKKKKKKNKQIKTKITYSFKQVNQTKSLIWLILTHTRNKLAFIIPVLL